MIESLTRTWCQIFGHKWQPIMPDDGARSVCHVCLRCRENGWRIRTNW